MTLGTRPRYVLDASIAMKWYLDDEPHAEQAVQVLTAFSQGHIGLVTPHHIHYEVANALRSAIRQGRISEVDGSNALISFFDLDVPVVTGTRSILRAWEMSRLYECALYDGLYVALADMTRPPLIHADTKLRRTLDGRFPHELWIEQFRVDNPDPA